MVLDNLSITKILLLRLLQQIKVIVNPKRRSNIKKVEVKSRWSQRAPCFSTMCAKYLLRITVNEESSLFSGPLSHKNEAWYGVLTSEERLICHFLLCGLLLHRKLYLNKVVLTKNSWFPVIYRIVWNSGKRNNDIFSTKARLKNVTF